MHSTLLAIQLISEVILIFSVVNVSFDPAMYTINEADGMVTLIIVKQGEIDRDITLSFSTIDGSAISVGKYKD